jgi:hypothetical protein
MDRQCARSCRFASSASTRPGRARPRMSCLPLHGGVTLSPAAARRTALQHYLQAFFGGSLRLMLPRWCAKAPGPTTSWRCCVRTSQGASGKDEVMTALTESVSAWRRRHGAPHSRATVTLLLMLLAVRLARQSRASVRHLVLTAGFMVLAVLPWPGERVSHDGYSVSPRLTRAPCARPLEPRATRLHGPTLAVKLLLDTHVWPRWNVNGQRGAASRWLHRRTAAMTRWNRADGPR